MSQQLVMAIQAILGLALLSGSILSREEDHCLCKGPTEPLYHTLSADCELNARQKGRNSTLFGCGGALINKRYVLTVAQCVHPYTLGPYKPSVVRLGENYLDSDPDCETDIFSGRIVCAPRPQDFGIEEVIIHPEYEPTSVNKHHDIALIRLDRDANLDTAYVKPICLPTTAGVEVGKELLLAKWGRTNTGAENKFKLKVEVPVVSNEECDRIYSQTRIGEGQMCAGGVSGKDSCRGDAGMPLMDWTDSLHGEGRRYSAVGLVSYGTAKCGLPGWPSVYTKVFHYVPWILENIQP